MKDDFSSFMNEFEKYRDHIAPHFVDCDTAPDDIDYDSFNKRFNALLSTTTTDDPPTPSPALEQMTPPIV